MEPVKIIDVTIIEPKRKHPTIFENFDLLKSGEGFIIHNDHDPKPLYYQLLGERGNIFTWEYLEEGPEWWKVKIAKLNEGEKESTIGDLVTKDFRKAEIFKKYGLDFCCGGKKTLTEACKTKGLDVVQIEKELKEVDTIVANPSQDFNTWELGFLADYVANTHHNYIKKAIPVISEYTKKVAKVHGANHPEAIAIAKLFEKVADDLITHLGMEENILFPYMKKLAAANASKSKIQASPFGSVQNPIYVMEQEHELAGDIMEEIAELSNRYEPPYDACTTFRLSYAKLKEFEDDLHQHIHLENNILFPKAIEMEKQLS